MSNKYSSVSRTMRARVLDNGTISPPTEINPGTINLRVNVLNTNRDYMNPNSNFVIRRIGMFSNFADGLVFKDPWFTWAAKIFVTVGNRSALTGSWSGGADGRQLTTGAGTGNATSANVFDGLLFGDLTENSQSQYYIKGSGGDDDTINVSDYIMEAGVSAKDAYRIIAAGGSFSADSAYLGTFRELNYMYDVDELFNPLQFVSVGTSITELIIAVQPQWPTIQFGNPQWAWLTDAINTDFDQDEWFVDFVADVEYTPKNSFPD